MLHRDTWQRRDFLKRSGATLAAGGLGLYRSLALAADLNDGHPLAPRRAHFEPKAKHLIVVFLTGGFSHVDTFDYKPRLKTDHGKITPSVDLRGTGNLPLMATPFKFAQHGRSGLWISELFPAVSKHADKLCIVNSMHTDLPNHPQAFQQMHTGLFTFRRPSLGAYFGGRVQKQLYVGIRKNHGADIAPVEHRPRGGPAKIALELDERGTH